VGAFRVAASQPHNAAGRLGEWPDGGVRRAGNRRGARRAVLGRTRPRLGRFVLAPLPAAAAGPTTRGRPSLCAEILRAESERKTLATYGGCREGARRPAIGCDGDRRPHSPSSGPARTGAPQLIGFRQVSSRGRGRSPSSLVGRARGRRDCAAPESGFPTMGRRRAGGAQAERDGRGWGPPRRATTARQQLGAGLHRTVPQIRREPGVDGRAGFGTLEDADQREREGGLRSPPEAGRPLGPQCGSAREGGEAR